MGQLGRLQHSRAEDRRVVARPPPSPRAALGLVVCAVLAAGMVFQAGVLVETASKGFKQEQHESRPLLAAAARVLPLNARFASDVYAAGYALYPRDRVQIRFPGRTPAQLRRVLRRDRVRYLVVRRPLEPSLGNPASWTRELYRGRQGVVLEIR